MLVAYIPCYLEKSSPLTYSVSAKAAVTLYIAWDCTLPLEECQGVVTGVVITYSSNPVFPPSFIRGCLVLFLHCSAKCPVPAFLGRLVEKFSVCKRMIAPA